MRPLLCACCLLRGAESKGFGRASALLGFPRQRIEGTLFCRSQGLNRVQQAPGIAKAMAAILWRCQQRLGQWVGSSVVHLGDHNVPNALMFIDKYTQVPVLLPPSHACNKVHRLICIGAHREIDASHRSCMLRLQ